MNDNIKEQNKNKILSGFAASAILSVVVVAALTIGGEIYLPLKNWLKVTFYHHWIGKGVISFSILLVGGGIFSFISSREGGSLRRLLSLLIVVTVLGTFSIIGFFVFESFHLL